MSRSVSPAAGAQGRTARHGLLLGGITLAAVLVFGRAFQLQAIEGERWARVAQEQHQEQRSLPARRGAILDRNGVPLALTHETFSLAVAPRELRNPTVIARDLQRVLGISPAAARRATHPKRRWVVLPGRFSAEQFKALSEVRGLHWQRRLERFYPQGAVAREVLGAVDIEGRPLGGIEQEVDSVLRGVPGFSVLRRDARGRSETSLALPVQQPVDGADVVLTLDLGLQEIADVALRAAITETRAAGGDLLIADPATGDILAAVSRRNAGQPSPAAFTEPYEPGSTLKPFFVASLLAEGRATLDEPVHAENGRWRTGQGRVVTDVHPYGLLSLRDALRVSSNVAMAKLVSRLDAGTQFSGLRDFGFGTPTGIALPAESSGRLPHPRRWSGLTPLSLAMGYEIAATPLQMLMAYGALANGGVLMAPRLLAAIRRESGATVRTEPQPIRQVVPREVTDQLRDVLVSVVADGTATRASLATFDVAGKTGTSRRIGANGRYESGSYTSTFAGFFPARNPQLTIFVKLDRPQGAYYGGLTAAPVTRATLQAILAAHSPALDGSGLLAGNRRPAGAAGDAGDRSGPGEPLPGRDGTYVFVLADGVKAGAAVSPSGRVHVPVTEGVSLREGARRLHARGLRVRLEGSGVVRGTRPAAGVELTAGDTVALIGDAR